ncbi:kinesin-like protein KIF2A [Dysidea avara]|uniref:kinesin-like protein KIF2A n=1 Tax=Dysidea avara TaxID=196820 RepID=UPI00332BA53D
MDLGMDLRNIRVGGNVNIKRSDGRIHAACISGVDADKRFVSVEWFEGKDTKGKEIDFPQLFSLNPQLLDTPDNAPPSAKKNDDRKTFYSPAGASGLPKPKSLAELNRQIDHPISKASAPLRPVSSQLSSKSTVASNVKKSAPQDPITTVEKAPDRRKSNCVKEVERLKKNRDDRRAKAAENLQQRLGDVDRGHPNWEFLKMIREYRRGLDQIDYSYVPSATHDKICVCVRKRPLNKKELNKKDLDVITIPDGCTSIVHEPKLKVDLTKYLENHSFRFDYAFDETVNNETVYRCTAQPLVRSIFEQGMATCFAYGQTGSGKTHTMGGTFSGKDQDCTAGIYGLAAADVFDLLSSPKYVRKDLVVCSSYFEIYSGKVFDLLNSKKKLQILEDAKQQVQVVGLTEHPVTNVEAVHKLIKTGNATRTSGTTSANQNSSRSHAVFQLILRKRSSQKLHGKFSLIDLAGNERGADTMAAARQTRMEGAEINKSLLALKECIRALGRKGHLPFRASKLTQVLRDSFIGDKARTCMIAMISPGFSCCEHTLNTLRYADRVKELGHSNKQPSTGNDVPTEARTADDDNSADDIPPGSTDLQLLHQNVDDANSSAELLTFHEAVNNLVEAEELLVDHHKSFIQEAKGLLDEQEKLLCYVDGIDYDIGNYAQALKKIIGQKFESLMKLEEHVDKFQKSLEEEEIASKKVKKLPFV